jgi:hypothetical protein
MSMLYLPIEYIYGDWYTFYYKINAFPTLVIGIFILYPLVKRQAAIISTPPTFHELTLKQVEKIPKLNLSREKMLSAILWFVLTFVPLSMEINLFSIYGGGLNFTGLLFSWTYGMNWIYAFDVYALSLYGQVASVSNLLPFALICSLDFFFVRDIYRYLRRMVSRTRFIAVTVLSAFSMPLMALLMIVPVWIIFPTAFLAYLPLPLPILQSIGLIVAKYHNPHIEQEERVWWDDRSRMWWEPERQPIPIQPIKSTPERPMRHRSDSIRVPISYRIISMFRRLFLRLQSR